MYKLLAIEKSCDAKVVNGCRGSGKGIFHVCRVTMSQIVIYLQNSPLFVLVVVDDEETRLVQVVTRDVPLSLSSNDDLLLLLWTPGIAQYSSVLVYYDARTPFFTARVGYKDDGERRSHWLE